MSDYRDRMVEEYNELVVRMNRLKDFLWTEPFMALQSRDKELLIQQLGAMSHYAGLLSERIAR